jgi:hypothetical protein
MKLSAHSARVAAAIGLTATLLSALMLNTPAAQASPNKLGRTAMTGASSHAAHPASKLFVIQPNGAAVEAPSGTDVRTISGPYIEYIFTWPDDPTVDLCQPGEMCMWSQDHYVGHFLRMGGPWAYCTGVRFENTVWQDHVYSIWNRVYPGPSSLWNRASNGTYTYGKYAYVNPGYAHDSQFTRVIDAWVYDPAKTCRTEMLHLYVVPN